MIENIEAMVGKTMTSALGGKGDDRMVFTDESENEYTFWHESDCCESVQIEDIVGDLSDLVGSPIVEAAEISNEGAPVLTEEESYTWTFYRFSTVKGTVTVRWLGTSNGYYSEGVSFAVNPR